MLKQNLSRFIGEPPADLMNEESRIISAALDAALARSTENPGIESPGIENVYTEETDEQEPATLAEKVLSHPKLVIGFALSMVLASATYAVLAWCWYTSESKPAPEGISLMSVEDAAVAGGAAGVQDTDNLLKAADAINTEANELQKTDEEKDPADPLATNDASKKDEAFAMLNLAGGKGGDPFSPLVQPVELTPVNNTTALPAPKKDVLDDLQYTGYIGDINSRDKVALIKIVPSGGSGGYTVVKKIGEAFTVDGERIVLKGISKTSLSLGVSGVSRSLGLNPYVEVSNSGSTGSGSTTVSASSASSASAASDSGSTASSSASGGSTSTRSGGTTNPTLQEL